MRIKSLLLALSIALVPAGIASAQVSVVVPGIEVRSAPPPLRVEVQPARPSAGHTWIAGHWAWRGGANVWIPGRWALPPGQGYVWESARWENGPRGYRFYEGHWRYATPPHPTAYYEPGPPAGEIYATEAPPAPIQEVRPAAPFGGAVWIGGYWHWDGYHHRWIGGHWSAPRAGYGWVDHRWEHGPDGRWHYAPGHWAHR